ncbi:hypothetical protein BJV77DRAFT_1001824 [Russula vinacea]|nr:hypothetical protein BJV77DRAFT_1001824 [Russula vinacea]
MKSYIDRGVQAGSSLLQSRSLALDAEDPSFATSDSQLHSPPFHASPAYSHSPVNVSPLLKTEVSHTGKPRKLPQLRPSTNRHSTMRVFSLPEDPHSAAGKPEPNIVQRVVSMPEQRLSGGQLAESSLSTEGFDGSMLSGGSFLSGTDTTSDSVLIIENNCGLSEAFLSNQNITKSASPVSEKRMAPSDDGWITWAKSPPRPIPALHGPLSLPYARCPSGAEGTIIEEPDNLQRVIWGLDSEEHHLGISKQDTTTQLSRQVHYSPRHYKPSNENSAVPTRMHASPLKPIAAAGRTDVVYSRNPYNETIILENLIDRRTTRAAHHQDDDYDAIAELTRTLGHNMHLRESDVESHTSSNLDRNILSRVSARPAVGSALPQILIEPRSPEIHQAPSRRMTAMELAHQYQQHQLLKMQQQSLLPTPPSSSSPLWSSEFSPYNHHSVSPASLRHQAVQEQLRDSEAPDQLRQLLRERLGRNIMHDPDVSPLAPPAQINSASRLDYPGYDIDPVTSQALANFLATQDIQHLPPLSSEEFRYTQGHPQPQVPRSIPLARLMQRRLSSVPEEDSSPTIHGRSPSPPQVTRHAIDRTYLYPTSQHGYQYTEMLESSTNYSGSYLEPTSRVSQGKHRGSAFGNKTSTVGMDVPDSQGRYRMRNEGGASEKEGAGASRRAGGLRKTRGRPQKFYGN